MGDAALPRQFQDVEVADQIRLRVDARVLDRIADARLRSQMHDPIEVGAGKRVLELAGVGKVLEMEAEGLAMAGQFREPGLLERRAVILVEIVDSDDLLAPCEQAPRDAEADEAGGSGNECKHGLLWSTQGEGATALNRSRQTQQLLDRAAISPHACSRASFNSDEAIILPRELTKARQLSPEFLLVAACCRWPPSGARDALVSDRARGVDWDHVRRVAKKHRVEALVWHGLKGAAAPVPQAVADAFAPMAAATARDNLLIAGESLRLNQRFARAGLTILFVKGVTLGKLAYGDIALKRGWDIDILIEPDALSRAAALLAEAGYRCVTPREPSQDALRRWHTDSKESVWRHGRTDVHVELHTALVDNPRLLPAIGAGALSRPVEILPGQCLPTLTGDELFTYLCAHGASSAWFRLKWLADLAALVSGAGAEEIERLFRRAQELGAGRAAAQALLLADHVFETALPPALAQELCSDRWNRWLFAAALKLMAGRYEAVELHERRLATLPIHLTQLALLPSWRFVLSEAWRQIGGFARRAGPKGQA